MSDNAKLIVAVLAVIVVVILGVVVKKRSAQEAPGESGTSAEQRAVTESLQREPATSQAGEVGQPVPPGTARSTQERAAPRAKLRPGGPETEFDKWKKQREAISAELSSLNSRLGTARLKAQTDDPELAGLVAELAGARKSLGEKLAALPGADGRKAEQEALRETLHKLQKERQELAAGREKGDAAAPVEALKDLNARTLAAAEALKRLSREQQVAEQQAQSTDLELKALGVTIREQQQLLTSKTDKVYYVADLLVRQRELRERARQIGRRAAEFRK